jgi:hypothetical protein
MRCGFGRRDGALALVLLGAIFYVFFLRSPSVPPSMPPSVLEPGPEDGSGAAASRLGQWARGAACADCLCGEQEIRDRVEQLVDASLARRTAMAGVAEKPGEEEGEAPAIRLNNNNNKNNKKSSDGGGEQSNESDRALLLERLHKSARYMQRAYRRAIDALNNKDYQIHDLDYMLHHAFAHQVGAADVLEDPKALRSPIAIVSACDVKYEDRELNLIGSVHVWSPESPVIVYDLGMSPQGRERLEGLCNVQVRPFPFGKYPGHMSDLFTYAWKPPIIAEVVEEFGWALWLDSSIEIRAPLTEIEEHILFDGYFGITSHPDPTFRTLDPLFKGMGTTRCEPSVLWRVSRSDRTVQAGD